MTTPAAAATWQRAMEWRGKLRQRLRAPACAVSHCQTSQPLVFAASRQKNTKQRANTPMEPRQSPRTTAAVNADVIVRATHTKQAHTRAHTETEGRRKSANDAPSRNSRRKTRRTRRCAVLPSDTCSCPSLLVHAQTQPETHAEQSDARVIRELERAEANVENKRPSTCTDQHAGEPARNALLRVSSCRQT